MPNETDALNEAIVVLKEKRAQEHVLLKQQLHATYESLRLVNLIKSTFNEVASSPEIKTNIVDDVIGIGTGILSKKLLVGSSHNPVRRLLGTLIQYAVANIVSKNAGSIKSTGEKLWHRYLKKNQKTEITD